MVPIGGFPLLRPLAVLAAALSLFAPAVLAEGPAYTLTVAPDAASYTSAEVATGLATITVTLVDAEGAPVADAPVSGSIIRQPWVGNAAREIRFSGATGEDGSVTIVVPAEAAAPLTYRLTATYTGIGQTVADGVLTVTAV